MRRLTLLSWLAMLGACGQGGGAAEPSSTGQSAAAPSGPYPAVAVLDAFREACGPTGTQDQLRDAAVAAGWTLVPDPATTPLADNIAAGREMAETMLKNQGGASELVLLRREVAGESLYLLLTQVTGEGFAAGECRLYDVGETRPIPTDVATRWIGRAPAQSASQPDSSRDSWSPALDGGEGNFKILRLAEGSSAALMARVAGLIVATDRAPVRQ